MRRSNIKVNAEKELIKYRALHRGAAFSDDFVSLCLLSSVMCDSRHFFHLCRELQAHFQAGVFQIWVKNGSIFKVGESREARLACQDLQCKRSPRFENKVHETWRGLRETSLSVMDKRKANRMWLRRTLKEYSAFSTHSVWLCKFAHANTDTPFCTVLWTSFCAQVSEENPLCKHDSGPE